MTMRELNEDVMIVPTPMLGRFRGGGLGALVGEGFYI